MSVKTGRIIDLAVRTGWRTDLDFHERALKFFEETIAHTLEKYERVVVMHKSEFHENALKIFTRRDGPFISTCDLENFRHMLILDPDFIKLEETIKHANVIIHDVLSRFLDHGCITGHSCADELYLKYAKAVAYFYNKGWPGACVPRNYDSRLRRGLRLRY